MQLKQILLEQWGLKFGAPRESSLPSLQHTGKVPGPGHSRAVAHAAHQLPHLPLNAGEMADLGCDSVRNMSSQMLRTNHRAN